jgi:hypothetical protein
MKSTDLVKQLSATGKEDLASSEQWINPMPFKASGIIEKINIAITLVNYSHNRAGSPPATEFSKNQLAALNRLKAEIANVLKINE